jgi:hypothetical protein
MEQHTPAIEPPTDEDLDRIVDMIQAQPADQVVRVADIGPLVLRLVAEVRRLAAENRRLATRGRGFDA